MTGCGIVRVAALLASVGLVASAPATWSIILVDTESGEIGLASATCVAGINLKQHTPVLRIGVGGATAQSFVDTTGQNRLVIWNELARWTPPQEILEILDAQDSGHQTRQYGIVDRLGRAVTFSGSANGAYAGGVTGRDGSLVYAIQGNVITGPGVVAAAEQAVLHTPGDLPDKLMAAMEAAHVAGGDGRCSCHPNNPTGCGDPPDGFDPATDKSAHVGYVIVARRGDVEGDCTPNFGCADGEYFLFANVRRQQPTDPEPVGVLRGMFDEWRVANVGVPDQAHSIVELSRRRVPNDGAATVEVHVEVLDWQELPAAGVEAVELLHDPDGSGGSSSPAPLTLVDPDRQVYTGLITAGTQPALDRFAVRVTYDGGTQRFLIPSVQLAVQDLRYDLNGDGAVDQADLAQLLGSFHLNAGGDLDGDGDTDIADLGQLLTVPGLALPSGS